MVLKLLTVVGRSFPSCLTGWQIGFCISIHSLKCDNFFANWPIAFKFSVHFLKDRIKSIEMSMKKVSFLFNIV